MRFIVPLIGGLWLALSQSMISASEAIPLETEAARISYSLGQQLASDLKRQGVELDQAVMLRGLNDGLSGNVPLLDNSEMQTLLINMKQDIVEKEHKEKLAKIESRRIKAEQTRKEGQVFLTANAKKTGVKSLPSGLQYKVIKQGKGRKPAISDTVTVHYRGMRIDGNEFGSTYGGEPETFRVNEVIPGMREALQMMPEGAKWELYIPPDLAFGRRGPLEDQALIYEMELLRIGGNAESKEKTGHP